MTYDSSQATTLSRGTAFELLPDRQPPWRWFGSAFGMEAVILLLMIWIPILMPQKLEMVKRYLVTPLAAPLVEPWKPQPVKVRPTPVKMVKVAPKPVETPVEPPPKPKIISPVFTTAVAKPSTAKRNTPNPELPNVAKAFPDAHPNALGSSALPTLARPREAVQTGGFGDPNGVPANGHNDRTPNIARMGSYDLPNGPGVGNGTGGAKGAKGVVASTGFGNGVATGSRGGGNGGGGTVKQGVFGDERPKTEAPKVRQTAAARTLPVEILFKPKPAYTDEARRQRIEGEVLLKVAFSASGQVEVLGVTRGLGYGLDEAAIAAARQIRFKPAQQDGHAVDSTATVHIVFELAY
jgi:TonB family protein